MLTIGEVASHWGLKAATVRGKIKGGELAAIRINRQFRVDWKDVWRCEQGAMPRSRQVARYEADLLSKKRVAQALNVSVRTVERWLAEGLPTRNVFGVTRMNPHDVEDWFRSHFGTVLPSGWWQ